MSYYEEDFYQEPNEFDAMVSEFKTALTKSVKEEYVSEMERLRKENESLQDVKANLEEIKNDFKNKERKLEIERSELERNVRRERLSKLMKDFEVIMYQAYSKTVKSPKCEKCDTKRRIQYTTPLGKIAHEDCECNVGKRVYYPQDYICSEFKINRDGNGMSAFYKLKDSGNYDYASHDSTFAETVYNTKLSYENIEQYRTFFKTKEECQGYCDYLNSKK